MKSYLKRLSIIVIGLTLCLNASATVIFSETFDDNSKGWKEDSNWQVTGGTYQFSSSTSFSSGQTSGFSAEDLVTTADFEAGAIVTVSYDFMYESPWAGHFLFLRLLDSTGDYTSISTSRESGNAHISEHYNDELALWTSDVKSSTYDQWYHYEVVLTQNTISSKIDGTEVTQATWIATDIDQILVGANNANGQFDNLEVDVVPEPATMMLLGIGSAVLCSFRRFYGRS